ncbi:cell division protein [Massilia sp. Root133]|uniref:translesion DNA synthesis-associated protein ImuA n=1 Tax=unclassified Massilia TaxID=2609279 RepID=UPI0006F874ED|nr:MULTISPECIES: translesion DNA synthesis-associated protein ImuA [unclassified Massilia]KQX96849.1 cell division protein [Massilia sp. Root133]KQZ52811.1 cell division protein [Massilia sp. Root1485]
MLPKIHSTPESIHPSLWRASQLGRSSTRCVDTGYPVLSAQLPGGGWPTSSIVELHLRQPGTGELRLLQPALAAAGKRRVMMIQPPHVPNSIALAAMGLNPSQVTWVQPDRTTDALWAAEQVLRSGGCHALLFWPGHIRNESLRRLSLAAADGESLFFLFRPLAASQDASPAPLRLGVRPALGGVEIDFLKRRGPQRETALFLPLSPSFVHRHALVDRTVSTPAPARSLRTELVE